MSEIDLVDAVSELRRQLAAAAAEADGASVQFPVGQVTLEFKVGATRSAEAKGGVKFWVLDLGSTGKYAREAVQTVTIVLGPPVDADGRPIKVGSSSADRPH